MSNPPNMAFYSLRCIQGNLRDRESHNSELTPTCQSNTSIINFCLTSGKEIEIIPTENSLMLRQCFVLDVLAPGARVGLEREGK